MRLRRFGVTTATLGLVAAALAVPTTAAAAEPGTTSLAEVLTSDGNQFDKNAFDYDIVTEAVLAVLAAKPESPVGLLTKGDVALTAFIPNDASFAYLAYDLTRRWPGSEKATLDALVKAAGVDAIEQVLLYHVIPGATITKADAAKANGAALKTAQGGEITVKVIEPSLPFIQLKDKDPNDINPFLDPRKLDLNKGNKQIAHGIYFVLRPLDL
jgi:hypothetical protein